MAIQQGSLMTDSKSCTRPTRLRLPACRALLFATTVALGLVAVPSVAQAAAAHAAPRGTCKVSAASVSAIVGYPVPAGTFFSDTVKATKQNGGISGVDRSCIFGSETSLAALKSDVILSLEVTSKPLTGSELKFALKQATALKFKFTPYSGLGMRAFYYTFNVAGTPVQGLAAINGRTIYSSGLYTSTDEASELVALVKLAEKL
jgi:hypothetical protein